MRDAETASDHTGTIPGAEETRGVVAYARVASADLARRAIGSTRPAFTRGLPTTACMHRFISAVSTSIRRLFTTLGLLSADIFECGGALTTRDVTASVHPVVRIHAYRRKCEFGEGTADGRRPHPIPDLQGPSRVRRRYCRID